MQLTTIELYKEAMKFSAGHFTIFSQTERERLHGHNFTVKAEIKAEVDDNGMTFDYGIYKDKILKACKELNEYFLIPTKSPYLEVKQSGDKILLNFNKEELVFLAKDVLLLPIRNITVEELAAWFLEKLTDSKIDSRIHSLVLRVFSGPGQSGSATWEFDAETSKSRLQSAS